MIETVDIADICRASNEDATASRARPETAPTAGEALLPLTAIDAEAWRKLAARAIEPNGYYLADWELAVNASAPGRTAFTVRLPQQVDRPAHSTSANL